MSRTHQTLTFRYKNKPEAIPYHCGHMSATMPDTARLNRILALSPRRFHISANPPFGLGIAITSQLSEDDVSEEALILNHGGITNCKPGIWRSTYRTIKAPKGEWSYEFDPTEVTVHWVEDGTIDIAQPVEDWVEYERVTRETDMTIDLDNDLLKDVKWESRGTFFDDGGVCAVLSTYYLSGDAMKKIICGAGRDIKSDKDEEEAIIEEDGDKDEF